LRLQIRVAKASGESGQEKCEARKWSRHCEDHLVLISPSLDTEVGYNKIRLQNRLQGDEAPKNTSRHTI
jgi:hypothetical protein